MAKKKERPVTRWFAVPLAIFIGVSAVFFLAEVVFRVAGIPRQTVIASHEAPKSEKLSIFRPDTELGWAYVPNLSVRMQFGPPRYVEVFFDENGIRVPSEGFHFDPAKPSILFVGCSFTMGHALFYDETFVGKISSLPQFPLQVVNLGVQAYGTDQTLLALKKFIARFNTKMVVYTFMGGHIERNVRSTLKPFFKLEGDQLVLKDASSPREISWSSRVVDSIRIVFDAKFGWFLRSRALTRRLVMEMKKVTESHGAKFVVIHWMWNDRDKSGDTFKGLDLDVINVLEGAPQEWEIMRNTYDDHPTPEANTHVAQLFVKHLLEEGASKEKPAPGTARAAK